MYGGFTPHYVYGIIDKKNKRNLILNDDHDDLDKINCYALDIEGLYAGDIVYGMSIDIGESASEEDKEIIERVLKLMKTYENTEELEIGYFLGISGNYDICHKPYKKR